MGRNLGLCVNIFRIIFIVMNILYMVMGIISIAIGAYGLAQSDSASFLTGSDIFGGAALLIICGTFVLGISVIGVLGAIFRLRPLLLIYVIIWAVIVVVQLIASILSFYFSANVSAAALEGYANAWRRAIEDYNTSSSATTAVDNFQETFDCCGYNNATDWGMYGYFFGNNSFNLPGSCNCTITDDDCINITIVYQGMEYERQTWENGCRLATQNYFRGVLITLGVVADVFAVIQFFGVIVAIVLICCITKAKNSEIV